MRYQNPNFSFRNSNIQTQSHCIVPEKPIYKPIVFPDDTLRGKTPIADGELWNYVKPRYVGRFAKQT